MASERDAGGGVHEENLGVFISCPPEDVWSLIADVRRIPEWRPHLKDVRWVGDPDEVGARFEGDSTFALWRRVHLVCRVTEWDPPHRFRYEVVDGPIRADALWGVRAQGRGSYVYGSGDIVGSSRSTRVLRPIAKPLFLRLVKRELAKLKELLENGSSMKAAVATRYGPPEVVRVVDVPRPTPAADELLVRVHATTVNRTDCGFRAAHPWFIRGFSGLAKPRRTILGNEFAGVVDAVGEDVRRFAVGDRVFGYDDTRFGGHAEYLSIGQDAAVAPMPEGRDFEVMAPATEGSHYALANIRAAGVDHTSDVLVYGATGAIGTAAVQLVKSLGAHVTAVCSSEHVDLVAGLGADRVIDRTTTDFTADTQQYDLVFDAVGKCSFRQCRKLLKPTGIWTSTDLGPLSQNPLLVLATRFSRGRRVLFPVPSIDREMVEHLEGLVESGRFTPVVDRTYPLEEIVEAYRYVETQQKIGNVVITVAGGDG